MRKLIVLIGCLIALACTSYAQDVIITKSGTRLNAKVMEVRDGSVWFKNYDNLNGSTYSVKTEIVSRIIYQNGKDEWFETENTRTQAPTTEASQSQRTTNAPRQQTQYQRTTQQSRYNQSYLSNNELISLMQRDNPELYLQYQSAQKQAKTGRIQTIAGGVLVATGAGLMIESVVRFGKSLEIDPLFIIGAPLLITGDVMLAIGIPKTVRGGIRKRRALNTYKRNLYSTQPASQFQLNIHGNGLGLAYVF